MGHQYTEGANGGIYEDAFSDSTVVRLGDASIASPFTARTAKLSCVLAVIRQVVRLYQYQSTKRLQAAAAAAAAASRCCLIEGCTSM